MKKFTSYLFIFISLIIGSCTKFQKSQKISEVSSSVNWKEFISVKFNYKINCLKNGVLDENRKSNGEIKHFESVSRLICTTDSSVLMLDVIDWEKNSKKSEIKDLYINAQKRVGSLDKKLIKEVEITQNGLNGKELIFVGEKNLIGDAIEKFSDSEIIKNPKRNYMIKRILFDGERIYELEFQTFNTNETNLENLDENNKNISEKFFNSFKLISL